MKDITSYIKESAVDINKYYKKLTDFKDGEDVILAWIDEDGYAHPFNVIVKKTGSKVEFINPDNKDEVIDWHEFANSTDDSFREEKNPAVATAKTVKQMQRFCDHYNDIRDM